MCGLNNILPNIIKGCTGLLLVLLLSPCLLFALESSNPNQEDLTQREPSIRHFIILVDGAGTARNGDNVESFREALYTILPDRLYESGFSNDPTLTLGADDRVSMASFGLISKRDVPTRSFRLRSYINDYSFFSQYVHPYRTYAQPPAQDAFDAEIDAMLSGRAYWYGYITIAKEFGLDHFADMGRRADETFLIVVADGQTNGYSVDDERKELAANATTEYQRIMDLLQDVKDHYQLEEIEQIKVGEDIYVESYRVRSKARQAWLVQAPERLVASISLDDLTSSSEGNAADYTFTFEPEAAAWLKQADDVTYTVRESTGEVESFASQTTLTCRLPFTGSACELSERRLTLQVFIIETDSVLGTKHESFTYPVANLPVPLRCTLWLQVVQGGLLVLAVLLVASLLRWFYFWTVRTGELPLTLTLRDLGGRVRLSLRKDNTFPIIDLPRYSQTLESPYVAALSSDVPWWNRWLYWFAKVEINEGFFWDDVKSNGPRARSIASLRDHVPIHRRDAHVTLLEVVLKRPLAWNTSPVQVIIHLNLPPQSSV